MFSTYFWLNFWAVVVPMFALWLAWELRKSELRESELEYRKTTTNVSLLLACAMAAFSLDPDFGLLPEFLRWAIGISLLILLVLSLRAWGQIVGILRRDSRSTIPLHYS